MFGCVEEEVKIGTSVSPRVGVALWLPRTSKPLVPLRALSEPVRPGSPSKRRLMLILVILMISTTSTLLPHVYTRCSDLRICLNSLGAAASRMFRSLMTKKPEAMLTSYFDAKTCTLSQMCSTLPDRAFAPRAPGKVTPGRATNYYSILWKKKLYGSSLFPLGMTVLPRSKQIGREVKYCDFYRGIASSPLQPKHGLVFTDIDLI